MKIEKKVLLMILDGWGLGDHKKDDAIFQAHPEYINALTEKYPHAQLLTSGEDVGLPEGQMGNSEVGHLNIGAGRVVYQDLVKINRACRDGSIMRNPEIVKAFEYARSKGVQVHFMGLLSDGGVHSSMDHLFALCDISRHYGIENTYIHCFMDGRDTDPKSGKGFVEALEKHIAQPSSTGTIATVIGRYYAMDRDKRWERVKVAYDALVSGIGEVTSAPADLAAAVQASYDAGVTDEFIKPIVGVGADGKPVGTIREDDMVIFFNFRNDRAKELTEVLTQNDMPEAGMHTIPLYYCTMTPYDASFVGLHILFDKENVENPVGEYISSLGLKQLRIAETEKYAHVTFFLNGGREATFPGEERILVPSPKVATYDLQPEMSAPEVADKLVEAIKTGKFDFIALNFANGDMVGHTGVYDAIVQAVKTVDKCAGKVIDAAKAAGYEVVIIADHGNADHVLNADGSPNTAHSLNPVPIIVVSDRVTEVQNGVLADVAPTVLKLMGLPQPAEMTGHALVRCKSDMKRIKAVIFDLDGTIADTVPFIIKALRQAIEPFVGREISDAEIAATFGPSEEGSIRALAPDSYDKSLAAYVAYYEAFHDLCPPPFAGIEDLLKMLKAKDVRIAMVTGRGRPSADFSLRCWGLYKYFEIIETGIESGPNKPAGIRYVLSHFSGIGKDEVVYVGDTVSDIFSSREAGIPIVSAAWAPSVDPEQLRRLAPDQLFHTVADFSDWLSTRI